METAFAGRSRVDVKVAVFVIVFHHEDMRMAGYHQPGLFAQDDLPGPGVVPAGRSSDVDHEHLYLLAIEQEMFAVFLPEQSPVDVAVHGPQRFEVVEPACRFTVADVAGMPDFMAVPEKIKDLFVQERMCI